MTFKYIKRRYGITLKRGQRVLAYGEKGVVTEAKGGYVRIRLDGHKRSNGYHPTHNIIYLDPQGE